MTKHYKTMFWVRIINAPSVLHPSVNIKGNVLATFWKTKLMGRSLEGVRGGVELVCPSVLFVWMSGKISSRAQSAAPKCSHKSRDGTFECVGLRFVAKSSWTLLTNSQPPRYYIVFVLIFFHGFVLKKEKDFCFCCFCCWWYSLAAFFLSRCCSGDCR